MYLGHRMGFKELKVGSPNIDAIEAPVLLIFSRI